MLNTNNESHSGPGGRGKPPERNMAARPGTAAVISRPRQITICTRSAGARNTMTVPFERFSTTLWPTRDHKHERSPLADGRIGVLITLWPIPFCRYTTRILIGPGGKLRHKINRRKAEIGVETYKTGESETGCEGDYHEKSSAGRCPSGAVLGGSLNRLRLNPPEALPRSGADPLPGSIVDGGAARP